MSESSWGVSQSVNQSVTELDIFCVGVRLTKKTCLAYAKEQGTGLIFNLLGQAIHVRCHN